jgi:hypothetical protein
MFIRDRIRELRRVPAGQLRPNPKNWRTHPPAQRDALKGLLAELGYCDALLVRELETALYAAALPGRNLAPGCKDWGKPGRPVSAERYPQRICLACRGGRPRVRHQPRGRHAGLQSRRYGAPDAGRQPARRHLQCLGGPGRSGIVPARRALALLLRRRVVVER